MKITSDSIILTHSDISSAGGISAAILEACQESDKLASGTIGQTFACSGPGSGWQKNFDVSDFAARALDDEYGAIGYVDSDDGRLATLDDDGDVTWTDNSVVELVCPDEDDALNDAETTAKMFRAITCGHCIPSDREAWVSLLEHIHAAAKALDEIDASDL